jgi:hypothetical protein
METELSCEDEGWVEIAQDHVRCRTSVLEALNVGLYSQTFLCSVTMSTSVASVLSQFDREFRCAPPHPEWLWGPTQPPIQWVLGVLSLGVKQQGPEADHSPPSSAKVESA